MNHQQHRTQQKSRTIDSNPNRKRQSFLAQEDEDPHAPSISIMADDENNNPPLVHAVAVTDIEDGSMPAQQMVGTSLRSDKKKSGFVEFMRKPIKIKCNNISYGCLVLTFVLFVGVFVLVETVFPPETGPTDIPSTTEPEPIVVENKTTTTTTTAIQPIIKSPCDGFVPSCSRIQVKATGKFLHLDGSGDKLLSTRYQHQPEDDVDYTKFVFEEQDDTSYRIKVKADSSYLHEDGNHDKLISTRYQVDDDFSRFFLECQEDDNTFHKIRVKANGRYWHEDGGTTELVSTRWQPEDDFVKFLILSCEEEEDETISSPSPSTPQIQELLLSSTNYKFVSKGTCETNEMLAIYDRDACVEAATSLDYKIEWGPHGGYKDVVDGCSIRFGAHLFLNSQEGTCDPDVNVGQWTYTECQCTDWMPCFCAEEIPVKVFYKHIPNTYCEYYEQGGDGDCSNGLPFVDVWKKCLKDGSDKCMGVMWNSCEGPTSDTSVNGAWKLMTAGQDVGDANNPTDTCGGMDQALENWDVFLVV